MDKECDRYYDYLVDNGIATAEELGLAMALCGITVDTMKDVLFIRTGYRSIEQIEEEEAED